MDDFDLELMLGIPPLKRYTINEFLSFAKLNNERFIRYFEAIIDRFGNIILVSPSHQETLIRLVCEKYKLTKNEVLECIDMYLSPLHFIISKENYISCWYNYIIYHDINKRQDRTIRILKEHGYISKLCDVNYTNEYQAHLERIEMGIDDKVETFEERKKSKNIRTN